MRKKASCSVLAFFLSLVLTINILPMKVSATSSLELLTQPQDYVGNVGDTARFTVEAVGDGLTYQWQMQKGSGKWTDSTLSSASTATLKVSLTESRNGYKYRCIISDQYGNSVESEAALLAIETDPVDLAILTQPQDYIGNVGDAARFTVEAVGDGLTYQWQMQKGSGKWTDSTLSSASTATLKVSFTESRNGYKYRCIVSDKYGNSLESDAALLATEVESVDLAILTQPQDFIGNVGDSARFTVVAVGVGLTYQWQMQKGSGSWTDSTLSSAKTATLKVSFTESRNGYKYRCIVSDKYGNSVESDAALLATEVKSDELAILTQPQDFYGNIGDTAKFTVVAVGDGLTYQWQMQKGSGKWTDSTLSSAKTATLKVSFTESRNGYKYRCIISDQYGNCMESKAALLAIEIEPVDLAILTQPQDVVGFVGDTARFTVEAVGDGLTYQWQMQKGSGKWTDSTLSSASTATLKVSMTESRNGYKYRCIITDKYGNSVESEPALLEVSQCYKITLNANGGCFDGDSSVTTMDHELLAGDPVGIFLDVIYNPENENYAVEGWYLDPECTKALESWDYVPTSDMTLYANWVEGVKVTWDGNGGYIEAVSDVPSYSRWVPKDQVIGYEFSASNGDLAFAGWYLDPECTIGVSASEYVPTEEVTFYVKWAQAAIVTWVANGGTFEGSDVFVQKIPCDTIIRDYYWNEPTKADCMVEGWYLDPQCTMSVDLFEYVLTGDISLYANWIPAAYVTWNANGGFFRYEYEGAEPEFESVVTDRVGVGSSDIYYPGPERTGYAFDGWCLDEACTKRVDLYEYTITEDIIFYANWVEGVKVTWDARGGYVWGNSDYLTYTQTVAKDRVLNGYVDCEKAGYSFGGWYSDPKLQNAVDFENYVVTGDVTFYAKWAETAEITWDANNGHLEGDTTITSWTDTVIKGELCPYYYVPVREGYTFEGWVTSLEFANSGTNYATVGSGSSGRVNFETYIVTQDVTFYAKWSNTVSVNWDANGGRFSYIENVPKGQRLESFRDAEKDGMVLEGWYLDEQLTNRLYIGYLINRDVTFYAKWATPANITWDANGGYLFGDPEIGSYEEVVAQGKALNSTLKPEREGSVFDGWYLEPSFDNRVDVYEYVPTQDITFYAKWKQGITVTFNANGGSMDANNQSAITYDVLAYEKVGFVPNTSRSGYVFLGWCLDEACNNMVDNVAEYVPTTNTIFYAKWGKKAEAETITVTFDAGEGTILNGTSTLIMSGLSVGSFPPMIPAERDGYSFDGWYFDKEFSKKMEYNSVLTESVTVYAHWIA